MARQKKLPTAVNKAKAVFDSVFIDPKTGNVWDFTDKNTKIRKDWIPNLDSIIDILWPASVMKPTQLPKINQEFIDASLRITYSKSGDKEFNDLVKSNVLACVFRKGRNNHNIFFNPTTEADSIPSMDLHEKGHVKFGHTMNQDAHIQQFKSVLESIWDDRLAKHFTAEVLNNPNNKMKIVKLLFHEFSNIAQDMEINSKLFDNGEWEPARMVYTRQVLRMHLKNLENQFDDLTRLPKETVGTSGYIKNVVTPLSIIVNNIKERIDTSYDGEDLKFCHPSNKGWPEGLDWMVYMSLLVKDFDETMEHISKDLSKSQGQSHQQGGQSKGQGSGKGQPGQGSGSGNGSGEGSEDESNGTPISQDILDQFCEDAESAAKAMEDEDGDMDAGDPDGLMEATPRGRSSGGTGKGKGHGGSQVEFETCNSSKDLEAFLRKECYGKKQTRLNTDVLYYSNRRKLGNNNSVVIPRRHFIDRWMNQAVTIIVDVSGSVNSDLVEQMVTTIVETNTGIDLKKSHIIFWDTGLVLDEIMDRRTKKVYSGGGTAISRGIKYAAMYMKKNTDKLFIISDLCDSLQDWQAEAAKIPGQKFVIGYGGHSEASNLNKGSNFAKEWNKTFKKTVFVNQ